MKKPICILIICFLSLYQNSLNAQQLTHKSPLSTFDFAFNPAMTALGETLNVGAFYRQQWMGFDNAPRTAIAFGQVPLIYKNMSIGAYILHDEANLISSDEFTLTYSYKFQLGLSDNDQLSIGILANMKQLRFDGSNAIANSQNDLALSGENLSAGKPNFGAGIFYTTNQDMYNNEDNAVFFGIGSSQLLSSKNNFSTNTLYTKELHANAYLGAKFVQNYLFFEPSVWVNYATNSPVHATFSLHAEMEDTFWAGLAYQTDNSLSLQAGVILPLGDGFLRVGALSSLNILTTGRERGLGYQFLVTYEFEL